MPNSKPPLHFSHANSFPAGSYRQFLQHFEADYDVGYIDTIGHDPRYPVTDCWPYLIEETLRYIEQRYKEPVIAVGHSLGGFLSLLGALQRPELFRAVILLDSPVFGRPVSTALWLGKRLGFIDRLTPGKGTLTRRSTWPDKDAAYQHFLGRGMFAHFDPSCLRDYVEAGTVASEGGVRLRFEPEVEHLIYCGLPHNLPEYRGQLQVPAGFIGGSKSNYVRRSDLAHMVRHFGIQLRKVEGGHLFPFEQPAMAATEVKQMIGRLLSPAAA
ncbi:alpha/beta fold hydrolase [Chitinimonas naiadis]